ncbi:MAG: hypothetical protein GTN97_03360 [Nitrosopumilaceae archaeon]|nr:hypothetical protein [Nitrosopumilaceae archaeon]
MSARTFGFDPTTVFGDVRKDAKRQGKKKKKDDMDEMMAGSFDNVGLGIDTFNLEPENIPILSIGEDFGDIIGKRAGQANGKGSLAGEAGFLGIIGSQQLDVPAVAGRVRPIGAVNSKKRKAKAKRQLTPLQKTSGSRFGKVDEQFGRTLSGNISGLRKRISAFREGRRVQEEEREPPQLEFKPPTPARDRPPERAPPMLPPPPESPRGSLPRRDLARGVSPT